MTDEARNILKLGNYLFLRPLQPHQVDSKHAKASRLWTPPARPEHPKRPDSGHPLPVQSIPSVQTLDALIPAKVQQVPSQPSNPSVSNHLKTERYYFLFDFQID